jgi:hypothetical protein
MIMSINTDFCLLNLIHVLFRFDAANNSTGIRPETYLSGKGTGTAQGSFSGANDIDTIEKGILGSAMGIWWCEEVVLVLNMLAVHGHLRVLALYDWEINVICGLHLRFITIRCWDAALSSMTFPGTSAEDSNGALLIAPIQKVQRDMRDCRGSFWPAMLMLDNYVWCKIYEETLWDEIYNLLALFKDSGRILFPSTV